MNSFSRLILKLDSFPLWGLRNYDAYFNTYVNTSSNTVWALSILRYENSNLAQPLHLGATQYHGIRSNDWDLELFSSPCRIRAVTLLFPIMGCISFLFLVAHPIPAPSFFIVRYDAMMRI